MSVPAEQLGFLAKLKAGLGNLGGIIAPDPSGDPELFKRQQQQNALLQFGLGTLGASQQSGATLGSSLAAGLGNAAQSVQQARQTAFAMGQEKRKQEKEDRILQAELEKAKIAETERTNKAREQNATVAQRVSAGIGNYKGRELDYFNLIKGSPEFQQLASEYGIDPTTITDPQQVAALGEQLGALGGVGAKAQEQPKSNLQLRAIVGPDGKPLLVPEEQAVNKTPYYQPNQGTTVNVGQASEGERKAATLGVRLEGALRTLSEINQKDPAALSPTVQEKAVGSVSETGANMIRSPLRQQAQAAQLDALDAALTLATGAAYTKEQLNSLSNSYFPQIGDDPATVEAKNQRYQTLVNSAYIAAGRAAPSINEALVPRGSPASKFVKNPDGSFTYTP